SSVDYSPTMKAAVLHHTAGSNSYATPAEAVRQLRADYAYHTQTLGWCDLGYNFVVDKFGTIYEGRAGGVSRPVVGAHAGGFNKDTFGVSMLGNYSTVAPSPAMKQAVTDLITWKLSLHGVDPRGQASLTSAGGGTARWAAGTVRTLPAVMGHRDVGLTACAGDAGYAILPAVRDGVLRGGEAADFVRALYADLLGRAPADSELDGWAAQVARTGDRWVGVKGFSGSQEFRRRFVSEAYADVLGRQPDTAGLTSWVNDLASGRATLDDLRVRLMQSPEFYQRAGGTDDGFVQSLYLRSLDRSSSASERAGWTRVVAQQGRKAAVQGIWNSYESSLRRVDRSYGRWLGRRASPAEQAYWSATVVTAGDEAMREAAMVSSEYLARARARF
ncbi:DUF4214 domain-containing protein, partial [Aquipuribacter hungaricus]|uniref:DUF4214 domain-containing protein n=1 Tax=Aquipuribacter hungaricus TaxID=545624 RepID=UPI0036173197